MNLLTREVTRGGKKIELHAREFSLLEYMLRNPGRVLSKTMILEHVWDYAFDPKTNVVDVLVCRLRNKIDREFDPSSSTRCAVSAMPSSWLKSERRTFAFRMHVWFVLVLIALTAALFVAAYWFLFRAVQERDREVIRAQFDVYRHGTSKAGFPR